VLTDSDPGAALEAYRETILVNPKESDAYFEMGQIYLKQGERQRALEATRKAVQLSPVDPDYRKALSVLQRAAR